jgi:hypothetical protein
MVTTLRNLFGSSFRFRFAGHPSVPPFKSLPKQPIYARAVYPSVFEAVDHAFNDDFKARETAASSQLIESVQTLSLILFLSANPVIWAPFIIHLRPIDRFLGLKAGIGAANTLLISSVRGRGF